MPSRRSDSSRLNTDIKIGIIDDDPITRSFMTTRLNSKFPDAIVDINSEPIVTPMLDVYLVDNDFNGKNMATKLIRKIRTSNPQALVVAMSATLGNETVQELINEGCNAIYDKNSPQASEAIFEVVANYIQVLKKIRSRHTHHPLSGPVLSLRQLLKESNQHLRKDRP